VKPVPRNFLPSISRILGRAICLLTFGSTLLLPLAISLPILERLTPSRRAMYALLQDSAIAP
jgi:hypothetical protein